MRYYFPVVFAMMLLACNFIALDVYAQTDDENVTPPSTAKKGAAPSEKAPFPFFVQSDETYDLMIDLGNAEVRKQYKAVFKKHNLPYEASTLEDIILQAVATDPALEMVIVTDAATDKLYIGTGNPIYRKNLFKLLQPVLRDETSLDKFIRSMQEEE